MAAVTPRGFQRIVGLVLPLVCFFLCAGFAVPSRQELRKEIRDELAKIQEMTPNAKERASWDKEEQQAQEALRAADRASAPRYAAAPYDEAVTLLDRARDYAKTQAYRKADYLARKARESAEMATDQAVKAREESLASARKKIDGLKALLDEAEQRAPQGNPSMAVRLDELRLGWQDLVNALALEQFKDVDSGAVVLDKKLRAFLAELKAGAK